MGRIAGWESRLARTIEVHHALPMAYGSSDCFLLAADSVEAVTGVRIFADSRRYRTEPGAARCLRRKGFATLADAFGSLFEPISVARAGRGDIGVVVRDGVLVAGVFTAQGFLARGETMLVAVPRSNIQTAWRVG